MPWEELAGATVLVTGATGLVGSFLVECLLARRAGPSTKVVVLSRDASRAAARLAHHDPDRWRVLEHALDAPVTVPVQVDYVVHAGAPARPDELAADPVAAYVPNVLGTHHLLEWAASAGVARFCFVSSGAANGSVPPELDGYGEDRYGPVDPIDPYACYAESKRMGEAACMAWWRATGMETVVARLGHTYGPGLSRSDTRSFAQFVHCAVDGRDILLRSDGAARRPFCYLSDAITGLLTVLLVAPAGSAYFVVNDAAVCSIRELADLVARLAPPPGIAVREAHGGARGVHPPDDAGGALPSAARLRALGWSPRVALVEGLARTIAAHRRS